MSDPGRVQPRLSSCLLGFDSAVYSIAVHLTQGSGCDVVDPLLVAHPHLIQDRSRRTINWLHSVQAGRVLALTFNDPGQHWWMVFARLESDGKTVKLTHRNSCAHWDAQADDSVRRTITLLKKLVQSAEYNTNKCGPFEYVQVPSVSTPRQVQSNSCGIHCCAHILLAARGQLFENLRKFDTEFIDNIRDQALLYYHSFRVDVSRTIVIDVEGERMQKLSHNTSRKRAFKSPKSPDDTDCKRARPAVSLGKQRKRTLKSPKSPDDTERKRARPAVSLGKKRKCQRRQARFLDVTARDKYVDAIELGSKTTEGRPNLPEYSWVQSSDVIRFHRRSKSRRRRAPCAKMVENVWEYDSWLQMFEGQTLQACLPGCKSHSEGEKTLRKKKRFDQKTLATKAYSRFQHIRWDIDQFGSLTLPATLTEIEDHACSDCNELTSVTFPDALTTIGSCAFQDCCQLTSLALPVSVTRIGDIAFSCCCAGM